MDIQYVRDDYSWTENRCADAVVITGNCLDVLKKLPDRCVDLVVADPPYRLQLQNSLQRPDGSTVAGVKDDWDSYADTQEFRSFSHRWLEQSRRVLKDTGTLWCMGSYHSIYRIGSIMQDIGFWMLNAVIWIRANPTPQMRGVRFCNAHEELIWAAKSEKTAKGYTFNYHEMKALNGGKQMRSDWYFPICQGKERLRGEDGVKLHSTQKPLALLERIVLATSKPGDLILDPFAGTGTTGVAALKHGRQALLIEKEEAYVETCIRPRLNRFAASRSPHSLDR